MTKLNKMEKLELSEAIEAIEGLIKACDGDNSKCVVFEGSLNKDYKYNIKLYTQTWILAPLIRLQIRTEGEKKQ